MEPIFNYYWDTTDPSKPFKLPLICNSISLVPEDATRIPPPQYQKGTIPCWDGEKWIVKIDWRQEKLYSKKTGKLTGYPTVDVNNSDLEENYTTISPSTLFDKWIDGKWTTDLEAEKEYNINLLIKRRKELLTNINNELDKINDVVLYKQNSEAIDLPQYEELCRTWRIYRGELLSMKFVTGKETFPTEPTKLEDFVI